MAVKGNSTPRGKGVRKPALSSSASQPALFKPVADAKPAAVTPPAPAKAPEAAPAAIAPAAAKPEPIKAPLKADTDLVDSKPAPVIAKPVAPAAAAPAPAPKPVVADKPAETKAAPVKAPAAKPVVTQTPVAKPVAAKPAVAKAEPVKAAPAPSQPAPVKSAAPAKAPPAPKAKPAVAAPKAIPAPAAKIASPAKPAPLAKPATLAKPTPATSTAKPKEPAMTTLPTFDVPEAFKTAFADFQEKAKAAYEKSTASAADYSEFAKGNMEAMVEAGKIFTAGLQELGTALVADSREAFETMTSEVKTLAAAKSPTDFFQVQSDLLKKHFDKSVAFTSKQSEAVLKLASETAAPISGRVHLAVEKVKAAA